MASSPSILTQFLEDHNEQRTSRNLSSLRYSSELERLAQSQLDEILRTKKVQHGRQPEKGLQNIANGKKNLLKPGVCVRLWMGDEGHKRPILEPSFTHLGIAYSLDPDNNVIVIGNYQ